MSLQAEGLAEVEALLKELERGQSLFSGVDLRGLPRDDASVDNAEILGFLHKTGRKFAELSSSDSEKVAKAAATEYQKRIDRALRSAQRAAAKEARTAAKNAGLTGRALTAAGKAAAAQVDTFTQTPNWTRQTAGAVLKAAMEEYMRIVANNIETQKAEGGLKPLDEKYKKWKVREYGFDTIGKLTGQLLENLDVASSAKAIRLITKK